MSHSNRTTASTELSSMIERSPKSFPSSSSSSSSLSSFPSPEPFPSTIPGYSTDFEATAPPSLLSSGSRGPLPSTFFRNVRFAVNSLYNDGQGDKTGGLLYESSSFKPFRHYTSRHDHLLQHYQLPEVSAQEEESSSVAALTHVVSAAARSKLGDSLCGLSGYVRNSDTSGGTVLSDAKSEQGCLGGMTASDHVLLAAHNASTSLASTREGGLGVTWNSSADCHAVSYTGHVIIGIAIIAIAFITALGNLLVLCTFFRHASLRTSSNLFIMNLTVADFLMGVTDLPVFAMSSLKGCWFLGFTGCQVYGMTTGIFGLVTIHTLAVIAMDRYIVVVRTLNPRNRMSKSTSFTIIVLIWFISIFWSALPLSGISAYRLEGLGTSCTFNYVNRNNAERYYFLGLISFNLFMPFLIINFSYWGIYISVRRIKRELSLLMDNQGYANRKRMQVQAEVRTAITSAVIVAIFIMSWLPYGVVAFYGLFGPVSRPVQPLVSMVPNCLAKLSIVANPILYSIGHPNVRKKVTGFMPSFIHKSSFRQVSGLTGQESFHNNSVSLHELSARMSS